MKHQVLRRQLKRLGLSKEAVPANVKVWQTFLERVNSVYVQVDNPRVVATACAAIKSHYFGEPVEA